MIPRYKRAPIRLDGGSQPYRFTDVHEFYRVQYYEVLDLLNEEISRRFDQASLALPAAIEDVLVKAINNSDESPIKVPDAVAEVYSKDINLKKLEKQLQMLPDLTSAYKTSQGLRLLKVTSVRSL